MHKSRLHQQDVKTHAHDDLHLINDIRSRLRYRKELVTAKARPSAIGEHRSPSEHEMQPRNVGSDGVWISVLAS